MMLQYRYWPSRCANLVLGNHHVNKNHVIEVTSKVENLE